MAGPTVKTYPPDSRDLIDWLDKHFPPRCIKPGETPEDAHRYAGKRELVDWLIEIRRKIDETGSVLDTRHVQT